MNSFRKVFILSFVFLFANLFVKITCFAAAAANYAIITPPVNNVNINKVWNIKFNMELNKNTVNSNNIMVLDEKQQSVPINVSLGGDDKSVMVTPLNNYKPDNAYSLIITKNVQAISGESIGIPKKMNFNTAGEADSDFKVCIDAGFGGKDAGQVGQAGGKESDVNLSVALKVGKILQDKGIQVIYTRTSDVSVDSETRFKTADDNNADYFISIHCNASKEKPASGIETYYLSGSEKGKNMADLIQDKLVEATKAADRGIKSGQYPEVKSTKAPGVKIYLGFMTTVAEEKLLCSEDFQYKSAAGIANGIIAGLSETSTSDSSDDFPETPGGMDGNNINVKASDVIAYSYKFIGVPYSTGGTSPITGFDCSGFVQYVYSRFNIKLSRDTFSQIKQGTAVNKSQLVPGDLVFFGTNNYPDHVGIYVGSNSFIHAPRTGETVKVTSLNVMTNYLCARRILN